MKTSPVFLLLLVSAATADVLFAIGRRQWDALDLAVKSAMVERMERPLHSLSAQAAV